jgi:hypothetical protein
VINFNVPLKRIFLYSLRSPILQWGQRRAVKAAANWAARNVAIEAKSGIARVDDPISDSLLLLLWKASASPLRWRFWLHLLMLRN